MLKELEQISPLSALHDWICQWLGTLDIPSICPSSRTVIIDHTYRNALSILDSELKDLLFRSTELVKVLDEIDEQLRTILSLVRAEEADVSLERDVLLGHYWTILGFNRKQLLHFDRTSKALLNVGGFIQPVHANSSPIHTLVCTKCRTISGSCEKQALKGRTKGG